MTVLTVLRRDPFGHKDGEMKWPPRRRKLTLDLRPMEASYLEKERLSQAQHQKAR